MKRFKQYIKEIFDSPVSYDKTVWNDETRYDFTVNDNTIRVYIYKDGWIAFKVNNEFQKMKDFSASDTLKIFSTIKQIISEYVKKHSPKELSYDASLHYKSKVKLYDALAKLIVANGYELNTQISNEFLGEKMKKWKFVKK